MSYQEQAIQMARYYLESEQLIKPELTEGLYVVWFCKTLQNWKCLISGPHISSYLELTHNGNKGETYIDSYTKEDNVVVKDVGDKEWNQL